MKYPEITIKIRMNEEGINVSEESSESSDDFFVPEVYDGNENEFDAETDQELAVPTVADKQYDLSEDYLPPSTPNDMGEFELEEEYAIPETPLEKEEEMDGEFSIPIPEEREADSETKARKK